MDLLTGLSDDVGPQRHLADPGLACEDEADRAAYTACRNADAARRSASRPTTSSGMIELSTALACGKAENGRH
jgi:hypothetical protein